MSSNFKGTPIEGFYTPVMVASLVTCLLPNATSTGRGFDLFREQLLSAAQIAGNSAGGDAYRKNVEGLLALFDKHEHLRHAFYSAHAGVLNLLDGLAATRAWSRRYHVDQATIAQIFDLPVVSKPPKPE